MKIQGNKRYWNNRTVLITGHEGFLGSWLAKTLSELGARVIGVDKVENKPNVLSNGARTKIKCIKGNITNLRLMTKIIRDYKPQTIFHIAAEAIVGEANKNSLRTFRTNIGGTWNILEVVKGNDCVESVIVASSDKAYGSQARLPYVENASLKGEHPYDVSKSCADLLCRTYYNTYKVPVCITRCGNIYGPGDRHYSRIVPDSIRSIVKNRQMVIRSNGQFVRDYIYIADVVSAYILLAEKMKRLNLGGEAFNFSNEKPISVLNLYKKIAKICGKPYVQPKILNGAQFEIRRQYLSSQKAKNILKWKARYSLDEGLEETVKNFSIN